MNDVITFIDKNRDRYLEELKGFLRIPSISTDPSRKSDVERAAQFTSRQLKQAGMHKVRIFPTEGHPVVYAERIEDPSFPTILVYGHYDVQPVDPVESWDCAPFDPTLRKGQLYARGASDDKGQVFIHFKSAEAFIRKRGALPLNLKYLIEGEEEIGSPNLEPFIVSHQSLLNTDAVLISDTAMFSREVPSLCYGLRGLAYFQVDITGPVQDLHSGSFGGPVANPAFVLAQLIAAMKDEDERITIPHFYDQVRELTEQERREFASLPFDEESYKEQLGVAQLAGEKRYTPLERAWARPTFEVNGILSGFTAEGAKTVIPCQAMAKISMRLVADQQPEKIGELFKSYICALAPRSVQVRVTRLHGGRPWVAALDHPALVAAAKAVEQGFGKRPVFQREGGTIPVVPLFAELLDVPSVLMGIGLPDENAHAPNERLNLDNFYAGIKSSAYFLEEFRRRFASV